MKSMGMDRRQFALMAAGVSCGTVISSVAAQESRPVPSLTRRAPESFITGR